MGPEGNIWVNFPITTFQQSLTHSALIGFQKKICLCCVLCGEIERLCAEPGSPVSCWASAKTLGKTEAPQ